MNDRRALGPSLEIVIVTASGMRDLLISCLESIRANPYTLGHSQVHVVDNASRDGTLETLATEFPEVRTHALQTNVGFAAGNNAVLREVSADLVLLLNPDTEIWPTSLDAMAGVLERQPSAGMAGCRLVQRDGSFDHAAKRSFPSPVGAMAHFSGLANGPFAPSWTRQYQAADLDEHGSGYVDAINGAFMLVRREAISDVGVLDEGFWMYGEDLDWCRRFKDRGWAVWYEGSVTILHVKGGGSVTRRGRRAARHRNLRGTWAFHHAMFRFYRKHQSGERLLLDLAVYAGICVKFAYATAASILARGLTTRGSSDRSGSTVKA